MAFNPIQFQHDISTTVFLRGFGNEAQCAEAVKIDRWPASFDCPRSSAPEHCLVGDGCRKLLRCNGCKRQTSLTTGSLTEQLRLPLSTRFLAAYLIREAKIRIPSLARTVKMGVGYPTDWLMGQESRRARGHHGRRHRLNGEVHVNTFCLVDDRAGSRSCRALEKALMFIVADSVSDTEYPLHLKRSVIRRLSSLALRKYAIVNLLTGTVISSDALGYCKAVTGAACLHLSINVGVREPCDPQQLNWVKTGLGAIKSTLAGAYRSVNYRKNIERCLPTFAYRLNRPFHLDARVARFVLDVAPANVVSVKAVRTYAAKR